jgi:prepilin-type N-terminal cleavage/methylation domain-containing protein
MRNRSAPEGGFTLIELMIVVVIIAILAAVVVPSFMSESRKTKGSSEVSAVFTEIALKEEQYKSNIPTSTYLDVPACPATPSVTAQSIESSASWLALGLASPESTLRCSYNVKSGAAGANPSPLTGFTLPATPATSWYWILATCELDGQPGNSYYLQSNLDSTIQKLNEGQ